MAATGDLIHQTSTTTGTGAFTLATVNGKRSFVDEFGSGGVANQFEYYARSQGFAEWEHGEGHESGGTLVRDTVIASSNAGALVNFSAGTKDIYSDVPADAQQLAWALAAHRLGGI